MSSVGSELPINVNGRELQVRQRWPRCAADKRRT